MIIEENPIEKQAMKAFHEGFREEGLKLQEKFVSAFRREYAEKDHCPCKKACRDPPGPRRTRSQLYAAYDQP